MGVIKKLLFYLVVNSQKGFDTEVEFTPELAEIVGIMFGDGNMSNKSNYTHVIRVCINLKKDNQYADYIRLLFRNNFNIQLKSSIDQQKNSLILYCYSKKLTEFFNQKLLIQFSPKKLDSIPQYVKESEELLKPFIRGLFDTDGCVIYQNDVRKKRTYQYKLVKICTKFLPFAEDIRKSLKALGISSFICIKKSKHGFGGFDVVIRHKNAVQFFNKIGSRNSRNIKKWEQSGAAGIRMSETPAPCVFPDLVVPSSKRCFDAPTH